MENDSTENGTPWAPSRFRERLVDRGRNLWIIRRLNGSVSFHDREPTGSIVCLDSPKHTS
jgi:hypothetical protein